MRASTIFSLSTLTVLTSAFPLQGLYLQQPPNQPRAKYSIVAIDGSSPQETALIRTEIRTITREPLTVVVETVTASPTPSPSSTYSSTSSSLSSSPAPEYKASPTVVPSESSYSPSSTPTLESIVPQPTTWVVTTTTLSTSYLPTTNEATVEPQTTAPPPLPTTTTHTYDDGMWHTTYPPWNDTASYAPKDRKRIAPPMPFPPHISSKKPAKQEKKGKKGDNKKGADKQDETHAITTITAKFKGKAPATKAGKLPTLPKITPGPDKVQEGVPAHILPTHQDAPPS